MCFDYSSDFFLSIVAIVISALALAVSSIIAVRSWYKSRSTYGLEELVLRRIDGSQNDADDRGLSAINQKLESGKYTVQSTYQRKDGDVAVLISKIKK